jgi:hypothetical protein
MKTPKPIGTLIAETQFAQERRFEELVAACMDEQGFDYVPHLHVDEDELTQRDVLRAMSPEEFAERYGYGVATLRASTDEAREDPNDAMLANLSAREVTEWQEALRGSDIAGNGCLQVASDETHRDEVIDPMAEFEGLVDALLALGNRIRRHPNLVEAQHQWSGCMADAGYGGFDDFDMPEESVFERLLVLEGHEGEPDLDEVFERDLPEIDEEDLRELQGYELTVAAADRTCRHELGVAEIGADVLEEFETEFVEEHREKLERFRGYISTDANDGVSR